MLLKVLQRRLFEKEDEELSEKLNKEDLAPEAHRFSWKID